MDVWLIEMIQKWISKEIDFEEITKCLQNSWSWNQQPYKTKKWNLRMQKLVELFFFESSHLGMIAISESMDSRVAHLEHDCLKHWFIWRDRQFVRFSLDQLHFQGISPVGIVYLIEVEHDDSSLKSYPLSEIRTRAERTQSRHSERRIPLD